MNDMQKDLLAAVEAQLVKVLPNGSLRRQVSTQPGTVRLYVEPRPGTKNERWDCAIALSVTFMDDGLGVERWEVDAWQPLATASYVDGPAIRALLKAVHRQAAADISLAGVV